MKGGRVRLRGTFVFEKRDGKWLVVQGHVSKPMDDMELAQRVFGTALVSDKPLQITCDDGQSQCADPGAASRHELVAAGPVVLVARARTSMCQRSSPHRGRRSKPQA